MSARGALMTLALGVVLTGCATTQRESAIPRESPGAPPPPRPRAAPPPRTEPAPRVEPAPKPPAGATQEGKASWYGNPHHGKKTASGETYDMNALTAAHRTLPLGTRVRVTNTENGRAVVVRINDRGPFRDGRIIDLSRAAARELGATGDGLFSVRLEVLEEAATGTPSAGESK
jgi:rare lipoprotein A